LPGLIAALILCLSSTPVSAQNPPKKFQFAAGRFHRRATPNPGNSPSSPNPDSAGKDTRAMDSLRPADQRHVTNQAGGGTNSTDQIQLSFQGANIDMVGAMAVADDRQKRAETSAGAMPVDHHEFQKKSASARPSSLVYRRAGAGGVFGRWWKFSDSILIVAAGQGGQG